MYMYKLYYACVCCSVVLFSSINESADGEQIITSVLPNRIKKMFSDIAGIYKRALMIVYVLFTSVCAFMHVSVSALCVLCVFPHVGLYVFMFVSAHMCVHICSILFSLFLLQNKFHMQKLY